MARRKGTAKRYHTDIPHKPGTPEYMHEWYLSRKDKYRERHLQKTYGISLDDFFLMMEKQNGQCGICTIDLHTLNPKNIHIDHCHTTTQIRGVLCSNCNMSIGLLKDDVETLKLAIKYLERTCHEEKVLA